MSYTGNLLIDLRKITGVGVLLNTSFNIQEPIVETPEDAIRCFLESKVDMLVIGNYVYNRTGIYKELHYMNNCLLTIDFEDFKHDLKRHLGLSDTSGNPVGLTKSIDTLNKILFKTNSNTTATYFITGQVARDYPDIVKSLSENGNEIACHGNFHDMIYEMDRNQFSNSLDSAITYLKDASGQDIAGFRAPSFSINDKCQWAFEEVAKRFLYDSSNLLDKNLNKPIQEQKYNGKQLLSLPLYNPKIFLNRRVRVIGGTFLKNIAVITDLKIHEKSQ